jgi:hypothetical protein
MTAKSSKELDIKELFDVIVSKGLTPNQFYLLCSMAEGISPRAINIYQDIRALELDQWVLKGQDLLYTITDKGQAALQDINLSFKLQKSKILKSSMGDNFSEMIDKYLELWPKGKLPSGKSAREAKVNLEPAFKWFFDNHSYTWETIFEATKNYEYEYRVNSYNYMRTSKYFIRKQQADKTWDSELANYCERVISGDHDNEPEHFSEKVV